MRTVGRADKLKYANREALVLCVSISKQPLRATTLPFHSQTRVPEVLHTRRQALHVLAPGNLVTMP
jgi:hypothetical protein